jgi:SAM-dependent methyltransferase
VYADDTAADVNDRLWREADLVREYSGRQLSPAEAHLLLRYREPLSGAVLELGPGAGRVTEYLADLATELTAFELSSRMAAVCRARVPAADVRELDLRAIAALPPASLDAVVASCNVIDVLHDADRRAALADVRRILRPGGVLLFSSHNRDAPRTRPWPPRATWRNPRALARQLAELPQSLRNHHRLAPLEAEHDTYALRNDEAHGYAMVLYGIGAADQERQLAQAGLTLEACVTDDGRPIVPGAETRTEPFLHYAARRPR